MGLKLLLHSVDVTGFCLLTRFFCCWKKRGDMEMNGDFDGVWLWRRGEWIWVVRKGWCSWPFSLLLVALL